MNEPLELVLRQKSMGKRIIIFGAGSQGRGLLRALRHNNIDAAGFIDRNPDIQGRVLAGLPVSGPAILAADSPSNSFFVIIAAFFFEREISGFLESRGFVKGVDFIPYSNLKPHDYVVEVSGACNLHCISCPRANRRLSHRDEAMMDFESFKKVLSKIRAEDPFVGNIQLYQWGEPTLNKDLPEIINYAREKGILCAISSNLNRSDELRSLVEARPECFRISVSGMEKNYETTHTGGNWRKFSANVEILASLRREIYPEMKIELYYHQYKHNIGEQEEKMAELSKKFDFEFHPLPAYIISLDDVLNYCEGRDLPKSAQAARKLLLVDIDQGLRAARLESDLNCDSLRVIMINADLSVSACMMFFDPEGNTIAENYLETPLSEILSRRTKMPLCTKCRSHGIHRYCGVFAKISEVKRF